MLNKKVVLTKEGYKKVEEKLEYLKGVRRMEVAERLKAAIALGDLSENSEYDDAKNEQAFIEGEILTLEGQLRNCEIIEAHNNTSMVHLGSTVVIKDLEYDDEETYTIVGSTEADTTEGKISNESPVGVAILGKSVGDIVTVKAPMGSFKYEIMEIRA